MLIVGGSLLVAAEEMVGPGNAVKRVGLVEPVAHLPLQAERSLAVDEPFFVIAQLHVEPADRVQRIGLPGQVPRGPE